MNENNNLNENSNTNTNNVNIVSPETVNPISNSEVSNTSDSNVNIVNSSTSDGTVNIVTPTANVVIPSATNVVTPNTDSSTFNDTNTDSSTFNDTNTGTDTNTNTNVSNDNSNSTVNVITGNEYVVHTEALGIENNSTNTDNTSSVSNPTNISTGTNMPSTDSDIFSINKKDDGEVINEKLKHVEVEYKPVSNAKLVLAFVFFIFLLLFIVFLPDISSMVNIYLSGGYNTEEETITTGKLICTLSSNTSTLDLDYKRVFSYTDSKLEKATFTLVTRGDITLDEATLDDLDVKCKQLVSNVDDLSGITVSCNYLDGELTEKQVFDYSDVNMEQLDSAFTEAGGTLPTFEYQQNIDNIEKTMNAAGYTCKREK